MEERRAPRFRWSTGAMAVSALLLALMLAALVAWFAWDAVQLLSRYGVRPVLLGRAFDPVHHQFGLIPFIWGSIVVGLIALVMALVLGMALSLTIGRRVPARWRRVLGGGLSLFVALPSVILGWWGLETIVPLIRRVFGGPGFSLLAAGLTLGVMLTPTLASLALAAVNGVAPSLEEASDALGASADQTLARVTLPAALPGISRAIVLTASRALAETMAVQMVIGSQPVARLFLNLPGSTLTTGILVNMAVSPPGSAAGQSITVMAALLLFGAWWLARQLAETETA
jgi:phosphate transport system permease protein